MIDWFNYWLIDYFKELFVTGCLASAILIACLNLYSTVLKEDEKFGMLQNGTRNNKSLYLLILEYTLFF